MSADPDVPVPESVITNTDPLELPIGCSISQDDVILLPDGTQFGICITGGRDLVQRYLDMITPVDAVAPPGGA